MNDYDHHYNMMIDFADRILRSMVRTNKPTPLHGQVAADILAERESASAVQFNSNPQPNGWVIHTTIR
jgi:hypothetical protein